MRDRDTVIGTLGALGAFSIWGVVPIFFKRLEHIDEGIIIAHRIIWSLVLILIWKMIFHRRQIVTALRLPFNTLLWLLASALLVSINWLTFVWAVNHEQVLSTSLGYFMTPLVNVLLGLVFLRERLTHSGWIAVALATLGTAYLAFRIGQAPWVALILAFSFGGYGLIRKLVAAGPLTGLWWEALWLLLPAVVYLNRIDAIIWNPLAPYDLRTSMLLVGSGLVTLVPLALFALAARRLPLSTIGFFQYLAPSISFLLAVLVYNESFSIHHALAFGLIWSALLVVTVGPRLARNNIH